MNVLIKSSIRIHEDFAVVRQISAVAFDFNVVQGPHEILRDSDRWFDGHLVAGRSVRMADYCSIVDESHREPEETFVVLRDLGTFVDGWLGKKGRVWYSHPAEQRILDSLRQDYAFPLYDSALDLRTFLYTATSVHGLVSVPDTRGAGLSDGYALHDAVRLAVLAQAAFRALKLHEAA